MEDRKERRDRFSRDRLNAGTADDTDGLQTGEIVRRKEPRGGDPLYYRPKVSPPEEHYPRQEENKRDAAADWRKNDGRLKEVEERGGKKERRRRRRRRSPNDKRPQKDVSGSSGWHLSRTEQEEEGLWID